MPFCFEEKNVLPDLEGCKSSLIVPCRFCPAASSAVKHDTPYFELFRRFLKTESYEQQISALRSRLEDEGIETEVFRSSIIHQFVLCMWTERRRQKLREEAMGYEAAVVMGCEAAVETVSKALQSTDCRVIQGLNTEGIMNVQPRFTWPGNIWLNCESVTRVSLEN